MSGQFGAGQFGADNSARTIRRDNSSRTIRRKEYNINLLENPALIQKIQPYFSSIPLPFQQYFFINPAFTSAIFFHQSRFYFRNMFSSIPLPFQQQYFFINPASISAIFFHQYRFNFSNFLSIPLPFQRHLFVIKYTSLIWLQCITVYRVRSIYSINRPISI